MNLNIDKIKSMGDGEIYNTFLPTIDKLKNEYNYIDISEDEYISIIKTGVNETIKKVKKNSKNIDISIIERHIKTLLDKKIKKKLNDKKAVVGIFNNYINNNIENSNIWDKISEFCEKFNYYPDIDLCIDLINNNQSLCGIVCDIVNKNIKLITDGNINDIFPNSINTLFIEAYCIINNIEFEENNEDIENLLTTCDTNLDNSLKMYLIEISRYPILTSIQEKKLAYKILNGDEAARKSFIECNLRLVPSIAKKYTNFGISLSDLIQEGNIALMKAVDRFDVKRGYKFSTYASSYINGRIKRTLDNNGRNIRIPVKTLDKYFKYKKVESNLKDKSNTTPTLEEIAKELKISVDEVKRLSELNIDTISLNAQTTYSNKHLEDFILDENQNVDENLMQSSLKKELHDLLLKCNLKPIEINVLKLIYIDGLTKAAIGRKYGVSREVIRLKEASAFKKIRRFKDTENMAVYMDNPEESLENLKYYKEQYHNKRNYYKKLTKQLIEHKNKQNS